MKIARYFFFQLLFIKIRSDVYDIFLVYNTDVYKFHYDYTTIL